MKVIWSPRAVRQLTAHRNRVARDSERNAALLAKRILDAVGLLELHANIGRPGNTRGTRELIVPGTPFVIPYRVKGDGVELIAILHGKNIVPDKM